MTEICIFGDNIEVLGITFGYKQDYAKDSSEIRNTENQKLDNVW